MTASTGQLVDLDISGMTCASCVGRVEKALLAVPGLPAPAAPIGMAMASGVADLPGLPAISIAGPDYDFTPPPAQAADPVARLRELMRERQQDSLRILSGWIDDKEKA